MEKRNIRPLLSIIGVNFIWGIDFIAIEYMMDYMSPAVFTLTRLIIGSILLSLCCFLFKGGFHVKKEDMLLMFASGAIGMGFYFTVENLGTGLTSASFSSLIMATVPIFGMIADRILYGNRITIWKVICILASIAGVYLLVSGEPMGISAKGLIVMLLAAFIWTLYITVVKPLYDRYDLLTLLTGLFISGLIVEIPITAVYQGMTHQPIEFTPRGILITAATAIICIIIGEFGYIYSIGELSTTLVATFENVLPLTTVLVSLVLFHTMLTGMQIAGALLIMASVTALAFMEGGTGES